MLDTKTARERCDCLYEECSPEYDRALDDLLSTPGLAATIEQMAHLRCRIADEMLDGGPEGRRDLAIFDQIVANLKLHAE